MGVSIYTPTKSGDMGYISFGNLRQRIAELYDERVYQEYKKIFNSWYEPDESDIDSSKRMYDDADDKGKNILEFLYAPDCEGVIDWNCASYLLEVCEQVEDTDKDHVYGYVAHPDAFTFGDFIDMLRECVDDCCPLWWN